MDDFPLSIIRLRSLTQSDSSHIFLLILLEERDDLRCFPYTDQKDPFGKGVEGAGMTDFDSGCWILDVGFLEDSPTREEGFSDFPTDTEGGGTFGFIEIEKTDHRLAFVKWLFSYTWVWRLGNGDLRFEN